MGEPVGKPCFFKWVGERARSENITKIRARLILYELAIE